MDELLDKFNVTVNYEKQLFEKLKANPYEIAVATSRYAREINNRIRKYFGPEVEVQARNIAMKKLEDPSTEIVYDTGENSENKATSDEAT